MTCTHTHAQRERETEIAQSNRNVTTDILSKKSAFTVTYLCRYTKTTTIKPLANFLTDVTRSSAGKPSV